MTPILIFPTQVFTQPLVCNNLAKDYMNSLPMRDLNINYVSQYGKFSDNTTILNSPECSSLKQNILLYSTEILSNNFSLNTSSGISITQSWISLKQVGHGQGVHYNSNSILSGVYYFNTEQELPPITFYKESNNSNFMLDLDFDKASTNDLIWDSYSIYPKPNIIIFFPSYLKYSISNNLKETKCLCFNVMPNNIGNINGLNYLKIN